MATPRTIQADELGELLELYRMLNPDDPELDPERVRGQWEDVLADDSVTILVVEHDDRVVSSCMLSITPNFTRGARPFALVENVVTHEEYRGQGFGRLCLEAAVDVARDRDCYKVMLLTGSDREWKHEFYESCGFDREAKTGFTYDLRE